jgi:large subunit ribosomal protein L9
MEVILREHVAKVGRAGEVVTVKDGYARNYLIPRGLAYVATAGNKRRIEAEARQQGLKLSAAKADAEALAAKLEGLELHFTAKAGEGDRLFGSVTAADIAQELERKGYSVDKRDVELDEPIKMIGVVSVPIRVHPEVRVTLRVWVVKEG